jgi:hypothetical protein
VYLTTHYKHHPAFLPTVFSSSPCIGPARSIVRTTSLASHPHSISRAPWVTTVDYDLAVGAVERAQLLTRDDVRPGDVPLGLPSTGLHANDFSPVRAGASYTPCASPFPWDDNAAHPATAGDTTYSATALESASVVVVNPAWSSRNAEWGHASARLRERGRGWDSPTRST